MSVTVLLQIASSFLLLDGIEPFLAVCSPYSTLKTFFSIFDLDPITPKIYLPQICTCSKSPISRLVWHIDQRCLGLPGGFRGWSIQWNHAKCYGADPCCHGNDIWARRGAPVAYRLVFLFVGSSVCPRVRPETSLTLYLEIALEISTKRM